jgi:hypothetical protein
VFDHVRGAAKFTMCIQDAPAGDDGSGELELSSDGPLTVVKQGG